MESGEWKARVRHGNLVLHYLHERHPEERKAKTKTDKIVPLLQRCQFESLPTIRDVQSPQLGPAHPRTHRRRRRLEREEEEETTRSAGFWGLANWELGPSDLSTWLRGRAESGRLAAWFRRRLAFGFSFPEF